MDYYSFNYYVLSNIILIIICFILPHTSYLSVTAYGFLLYEANICYDYCFREFYYLIDLTLIRSNVNYFNFCYDFFYIAKDYQYRDTSIKIYKINF